MRIGPVAATLVTGLLTLAGVLASNSRNRAVMEAKADALTKQVEKHNCLVECTYVLERDMVVVRNDIDSLKRGQVMGCSLRAMSGRGASRARPCRACSARQ